MLLFLHTNNRVCHEPDLLPWHAIHNRAAAMTLRTVLLSLQALLAAAEPDDPQDAVVANQVGHVWDWDFRVCHVLKKNHI